jgi:hypothetical protein
MARADIRQAAKGDETRQQRLASLASRTNLNVIHRVTGIKNWPTVAAPRARCSSFCGLVSLVHRTDVSGQPDVIESTPEVLGRKPSMLLIRPRALDALSVLTT